MDGSYSVITDSTSSSATRQSLVNRANRIIETYNLLVPRTCSPTGINYYFWAAVFNRVFSMRCNPSARSKEEQVANLKACLAMLEILLGIGLHHIQAERLLDLNFYTMHNLIEIIELRGQFQPSGQVSDNRRHLADVDLKRSLPREGNRQAVNQGRTAQNNINIAKSSKGQQLADKLEKSLKNHVLAIEIDKKIKMYLGDVSVAKESVKSDPNVRATRQSIVRTRCIQPSGAKQAFDIHAKSANLNVNTVLSTELLRLFPEVSGEVELMAKIQTQEKRLLLSERQIALWEAEQADRRVGRLLEEAIDHQRAQLELLEMEALREGVKGQSNELAKRRKMASAEAARSQREERVQRANLQKEIDAFLKTSTAAYLAARSTMEQILVTEFKKVDARQKQQINEIRKYLQNYYEHETDKLRALLDNFDSM